MKVFNRIFCISLFFSLLLYKFVNFYFPMLIKSG